MATIKSAFVSLILSDSIITGLIGDRFTPGVIALGSDLPAVTYQIIGDTPNYNHDGESNMQSTRMQITIDADNQEKAGEVASSFKTKLSGFKGIVSGIRLVIFLENAYDGTTNLDSGVHTLRQDYRIKWSK